MSYLSGTGGGGTPFEGGTVPNATEFTSGVTFNGGTVQKVSSTFQNFVILDNVSKAGNGALPSENPTIMPVILLSDNGDQAVTLPDGIVNNQWQTIVSAGTGVKTITVTTPYGGAPTVALSNEGEAATFYWISGSGWVLWSEHKYTINTDQQWDLTDGANKTSTGSLTEEGLEFGVVETGVSEGGYEFKADQQGFSVNNGALTMEFIDSVTGTEKKVVGVTAAGIEDIYYNENQSGNVDGDLIVKETYKGNATLVGVPVEYTFGSHTVEMTEVTDSPQVTFKWKNTAGGDILQFGTQEGQVAGFGVPRLAWALYDFSVNGGAQGAISLIAPTLPDNAVIYDVNWDVLTTLTSATDTATITVGFPTDGNMFTAALAINNPANPWDEGARRPPGALTARKLTANRIPQITVAVEDITAGKIMFCFSYWISS